MSKNASRDSPMKQEEFRKIGNNVIIFDQAIIVNKGAISIDDHTRIDDFTFINGGQETVIGKYVHIASFVSIIGGGKLFVGDYVGISAGARIITGTDRYEGGSRMSAAAPREQRNPLVSFVKIEKDASIGTNAVIYPGVTIREGAVLGINSLALSDLEPWGVYFGSPCKKIGTRPRVKYE